MIKRLGMLTFLIISLSGCITHCPEQTFYKPAAASQSAFTATFIAQTSLRLELKDRIAIDIYECGYADRQSDLGPVSLCITIVPDDNRQVKLSGAEIGLSDSQGHNLSSMKIEELRYSVFCLRKSAEPDCSSTLLPAVEGDVTRSISPAHGNGYSESFRFLPTLAFRGATDSQYGYIVPSHDRLRRYTSSIPFPKMSNEEILITLPAFIIDGKAFVTPSIKIRRIRESICHISA